MALANRSAAAEGSVMAAGAGKGSFARRVAAAAGAGAAAAMGGGGGGRDRGGLSGRDGRRRIARRVEAGGGTLMSLG